MKYLARTVKLSLRLILCNCQNIWVIVRMFVPITHTVTNSVHLVLISAVQAFNVFTLQKVENHSLTSTFLSSTYSKLTTKGFGIVSFALRTIE